MGVWLRIENKFSRNYFQLTGCFEGFDLEMVWSENFHFKPFPDLHAKREREREPSTSTSPTSPITAFDFDFANLWNHRSTNQSRLRLCRSTNPRTDLRPRATNPQTDLSLSLWFWFSVWFWSTHEPLISDFFVVVVVVFWWFSCCVVVGFVWVVVENSIFRMLPNTWKYFLEQLSECNQTLENIFLSRK